MAQQEWIHRLVRYQYIEELLRGRRVLEVGCGTGGGAQFLAERAAEVVAIDTASAKLAEARSAYRRRNVHFAVAEPDRLDQSDDAFDLVLVPELERWVTRGALVPELRRVLAPGGIALFAVPSEGAPNGMEYTDFLEYLTASFPHVRMLGEIPFFGTIMADFDPEAELEPQLDCTLVAEDEPPVFYCALCSDQPVAPLGYSVVQVGPEEADGRREQIASTLERAQRDIERYEDQVHDLEAEVDRLRGEATQTSERVMREDAQRVRFLEARVRELEELERNLGAARGRPAGAGQEALARELEQAREAKALKESEAADLRDKLADAERRVLAASAEARQELTAARRELREREDALGKLRGDLEVTRKALSDARQFARAAGFESERTEPQWPRDLTPVGLAELEAATADRTRPGMGERRQAEAEAERERQRAAAAEQAAMEARLALETATIRADAAKQALAEIRAVADQQRQRAEGAERRSDALLARLEQDAAELSRLHQRLAEMQGLRQADQWRIDELTGRLRAVETGAAATDARPAAAGDVGALKRELTARDARVAELEKELMRVESRHQAETRRATEAESRMAQMEVRLKRAEAEAATLSKWSEELREELKEAQGKPKVGPLTPEPEVAALREELAEARRRVAALENRCDALMREVRTAEQQQVELNEELESARRAADGQALKDLRARAEQVKRMEQQIRQAEERLAEAAGLREQLRDAEQAAAEARAELEALRQGAPRAALEPEPPEAMAPQAALERQVEALLDGALAHKEEADTLQLRVRELELYVAELEAERDELRLRLDRCEARSATQHDKLRDLSEEISTTGRELARVQGLLRRHVAPEILERELPA